MESLLGRLRGRRIAVGTPGSETQCVRPGLANFNTHIDPSRPHHGLHPRSIYIRQGKGYTYLPTEFLKNLDV